MVRRLDVPSSHPRKVINQNRRTRPSGILPRGVGNQVVEEVASVMSGSSNPIEMTMATEEITARMVDVVRYPPLPIIVVRVGTEEIIIGGIQVMILGERQVGVEMPSHDLLLMTVVDVMHHALLRKGVDEVVGNPLLKAVGLPKGAGEVVVGAGEAGVKLTN